jgi:hypothetical protein
MNCGMRIQSSKGQRTHGPGTKSLASIIGNVVVKSDGKFSTSAAAPLLWTDAWRKPAEGRRANHRQHRRAAAECTGERRT